MRGRRIATATLLVFGTLFWTFFGLGLWAKRQALETDNWVNTSEQLLESEPIRDALGLYIVDQLYDSDAVKQRIAELLPPRVPLVAVTVPGRSTVTVRPRAWSRGTPLAAT